MSGDKSGFTPSERRDHLNPPTRRDRPSGGKTFIERAARYLPFYTLSPAPDSPVPQASTSARGPERTLPGSGSTDRADNPGGRPAGEMRKPPDQRTAPQAHRAYLAMSRANPHRDRRRDGVPSNSEIVREKEDRFITAIEYIEKQKNVLLRKDKEIIETKVDQAIDLQRKAVEHTNTKLPFMGSMGRDRRREGRQSFEVLTRTVETYRGKLEEFMDYYQNIDKQLAAADRFITDHAERYITDHKEYIPPEEKETFNNMLKMLGEVRGHLAQTKGEERAVWQEVEGLIENIEESRNYLERLVSASTSHIEELAGPSSSGTQSDTVTLGSDVSRGIEGLPLSPDRNRLTRIEGGKVRLNRIEDGRVRLGDLIPEEMPPAIQEVSEEEASGPA